MKLTVFIGIKRDQLLGLVVICVLIYLSINTLYSKTCDKVTLACRQRNPLMTCSTVIVLQLDHFQLQENPGTQADMHFFTNIPLSGYNLD
jgi:hypothetical protein